MLSILTPMVRFVHIAEGIPETVGLTELMAMHKYSSFK